jgi:hypothetical protein
VSELKAKTRSALPDKAFAEPEKRAYPIEDKVHARTPRRARARR